MSANVKVDIEIKSMLTESKGDFPEGTVTRVYWVMTITGPKPKTKGEAPASDTLSGSTVLRVPDVDKFTPYDKLTKKQVVGWLKADRRMARRIEEITAKVGGSAPGPVMRTAKEGELPWQ